MYELIILSLLMRSPAHGYLIAKIINDMFGPYTKISNGRLYPFPG
jgi:DNA-binding PadR family transcriptional regulator